MKGLIEANIHFLGQAERLLTELDDEQYASPGGGLYEASIGQHLRHCLDHYRSFLEGLPEGTINYDRRERGGEVECLTDCALNHLRRIGEGLAALAGGSVDDPLKVRMDCGDGRNSFQTSTVGRELQFLVSHTVHHYAMITGMACQRGMEIEDGFGVAPSTLKFRELANID